MKNKRRHAHRLIVTVLSLILALLLVAPGVAPPTAAGVAPAMREVTGGDRPDAQASAPTGIAADEWATMQDLIRQAEYQFAWQVSDDGVGAYHAPNRAQGLSLSLAADGFHAARYREGALLWEFGLSLAAYGEQAFPAAIAEGDLVGSRERVEYRWSRDVVEWYVNSAAGVEHGLTLAAPPAGADGSAVELIFALRGSLRPELDAGGGVLRLKDAAGETALLYDQLTIYDATGRALPSHMRLSQRRQAARLHLVIDTAGAAYPLIVDPVLHGEVAKLIASDAEDGDQFGTSVAISGDIAVIGAPSEDGAGGGDRGAAYLFERNQGGADSWDQVTKLTASDAANGDQFGYSVAISGDIVVVGAGAKDNVGGGYCLTGNNCGAAYVFARNQGGADTWGQVTRLNASDADVSDYFGHTVAISGDTIVVGAFGEDGVPGGLDRGAAYVFERNQGGVDTWGQVKKLIASTAVDGDYFGFSVSISGDTIVVGAPQRDGAGTDHGAAFIFARNQPWANNWGQVAVLTAADAADTDLFGQSVAISGDTVIAGAYQEDGIGGVNRGAAYVFERNQGGADQWDQVTKLTASDTENFDQFGAAVAIDGDTAVVGAYYEDGAGTDHGAAYLFARNQGGADNWGEVRKLSASDAEDSDLFGISVALSGDTAVVGAIFEDGTGGNHRGAAYLFVHGGGRWQEVAIPRASDPGDEDRFGMAVSVSGDTAVVGAYWQDGAAGDQRGAAYLFERNEDGTGVWGQVTKLTLTGAQANDYFGISVAISGDTVVVGAYGENGAGLDSGAAYVFERNRNPSSPGVPLADNWGQVARLTASDAGTEDYFGFSVAISNDTLVVGAYGKDGAGTDRGAAYIFERNQGGTDHWGQVTTLTASDETSYDYFGYSVAISGDTAVVGAYGEDGSGGNERGAAYVFERNTGGADNWGQVKKLVASDAEDHDRFGYAVAISGDTAAIGVPFDDGAGGDHRGAVCLFERNDDGIDNWGQIKKRLASDSGDGDYFGISVAISNDTLVVGAHGENGFGYLVNDRGAAYVFERNYNPNVPSAPVADNWGQVTKLSASDAANDDYFGRSVAISGDTIIAGAYGENGAGTDRGAAYIFTLQPYRLYLPLVRNALSQ